MYRRLVESVRGAVRRWTHGDVVRFEPGPPYFFAEQPTFAPVRLAHSADEDPPVRVGRYCSLNETVTFLPGGNHPIDTVTTFFFYWTMGVGAPEQPDSRGPITVGSDVWAGRDVLIMGGVTVGHGAVIAARAVVTRDVAPFEIVGGVPARHIRWRFSQEIREGLLAIAWWDWPLDKVLAHRGQLTSRDVARFVELHAKLPEQDIANICPACRPRS